MEAITFSTSDNSGTATSLTIQSESDFLVARYVTGAAVVFCVKHSLSNTF